MSVLCPHCRHRITVKVARAGRFSPRCPRCNHSFLLVATQGPNQSLDLCALPPQPDIPVAQAVDRPPPNAAFSINASLVRSSSDAPQSPVDAVPVPVPDTVGLPAPQLTDRALTGNLGGYRIEKLLGRGGMGAVYLAHQISLGRLVALKVMNSTWASNPRFLVRFTREAFAAAQLVHHNIVQVYDVGSDRGTHFFSMEYVQGKSLGDLLRDHGRLAPEVAAGYVLQAARGLKFAHDRGMIHRDIKPDNLLLNDQGVVKVADLGLVRTPGTDDPGPESSAAGDVLPGVTLVGQAVGTPAFMAPEQARDAKTVDHRADIYSLGCTLYALLCGRPVFEGSTALAVCTQHVHEPATRPEHHVRDLPRTLADITMKMLAKKPDDRYQTMDEVITAIEGFLGLHAAEKQVAAQEHVRTLEQAAHAFHDIPGLRLRTLLLQGYTAFCTAGFVLLMVFAPGKLAFSLFSLGVMGLAAYGIIRGWATQSPVVVKLRELILSSTPMDLLKATAAALLLLGVLYLLGLLGLWVLTSLFGLALALGVHYALDQKIATERTQALLAVEDLLKSLRLQAVSEEALQKFVATHAGEDWEEFFEALFGYDAKLAARISHGRGPKGWRPRYATWREPVIRWCIRYQRSRDEARQRRHLQSLEQQNLATPPSSQPVLTTMPQSPVSPPIASAPIPIATLAEPPNQAPLVKPPSPRRVNVADLFVHAAPPPQPIPRPRPRAVLPDLLGVLFGPTVRFFLGVALLVLCLLWMHSRGILAFDTDTTDQNVYIALWQKTQSAEPLIPSGSFTAVPARLLRALSSVNAGAAGLLLLLSAFWHNPTTGFLALLGATVAVAGPLTVLAPEIPPLTPPLVCLVAGAATTLLGFLVGRDR